MRSVIKSANQVGIKEVVLQQFETARQIIAAGLIPIIEPEVDIHCPDKARAEELLQAALVEGLSAQQSDAEFDIRLDCNIQSIFEASNT